MPSDRIYTASDEARLIIAKSMLMEPRLTYFGIGVYDESSKSRRQVDAETKELRHKLRQAVREVVACEDFLVKQFRTKAVTRHYSSYKLKHIVEGLYGFYIPNGALCAAAIGMGFKYRIDGPNLYLNLRKKLHIEDGYGDIHA